MSKSKQNKTDDTKIGIENNEKSLTEYVTEFCENSEIADTNDTVIDKTDIDEMVKSVLTTDTMAILDVIPYGMIDGHIESLIESMADTTDDTTEYKTVQFENNQFTVETKTDYVSAINGNKLADHGTIGITELTTIIEYKLNRLLPDDSGRLLRRKIRNAGYSANGQPYCFAVTIDGKTNGKRNPKFSEMIGKIINQFMTGRNKQSSIVKPNEQTKTKRILTEM